MDWSNEEWRKVYIKDTPDIIAVGWEGRLVLWELIRKVDRSGVISIGINDDDLLAELLRVPIEILRTGLARILARGVAVRVEAGICVVNFVEAQEARTSDRLRQKMTRDRHRERHIASHDVTARHTESQHVTQSHIASREVTPIEENRIEETHTDDLSHTGLQPAGGLVAGSTVPVSEPEASRRRCGCANCIEGHAECLSKTRPRIAPEVLERVYGLYPRKEGKKAGLEKLRRLLRDADDPAELLRDIALAIKNYVRLCKEENRDPTKIKHFGTFVNNWTDYRIENLRPAPEPRAPRPSPIPASPVPSEEDRRAMAAEAAAIRDRLAGKLRIV